MAQTDIMSEFSTYPKVVGGSPSGPFICISYVFEVLPRLKELLEYIEYVLLPLNALEGFDALSESIKDAILEELLNEDIPGAKSIIQANLTLLSEEEINNALARYTEQTYLKLGIRLATEYVEADLDKYSFLPEGSVVVYNGSAVGVEEDFNLYSHEAHYYDSGSGNYDLGVTFCYRAVSDGIPKATDAEYNKDNYVAGGWTFTEFEKYTDENGEPYTRFRVTIDTQAWETIGIRERRYYEDPDGFTTNVVAPLIFVTDPDTRGNAYNNYLSETWDGETDMGSVWAGDRESLPFDESLYDWNYYDINPPGKEITEDTFNVTRSKVIDFVGKGWPIPLPPTIPFILMILLKGLTSLVLPIVSFAGSDFLFVQGEIVTFDNEEVQFKTE